MLQLKQHIENKFINRNGTYSDICIQEKKFQIGNKNLLVCEKQPAFLFKRRSLLRVPAPLT